MFQPVVQKADRFNLNLAVVMDSNDLKQQQVLSSMKSRFTELSSTLFINVSFVQISKLEELALDQAWSGVLLLNKGLQQQTWPSKFGPKRTDIVPILGVGDGLIQVNRLMSEVSQKSDDVTDLDVMANQKLLPLGSEVVPVPEIRPLTDQVEEQGVVLQRPGQLCRWFGGEQSFTAPLETCLSEQNLASICQAEALTDDGEVAALSVVSSLGYVVGVGWTLSQNDKSQPGFKERLHEYQLLKSFAVACRNYRARKNYLLNIASA